MNLSAPTKYKQYTNIDIFNIKKKKYFKKLKKKTSLILQRYSLYPPPYDIKN